MRPWTTWRVGLQIGEQEQQPVLRRGQWAGLINGKSACGPRFAVQTPIRHVGLKRRLEGRKQTLELFEGQTGEIEELRGAEPHVSKPYTSHGPCLPIPGSVCHVTLNSQTGINSI